MAWAPDYVTTQQLASYLRIGDSADNVELALAVSGASRDVDKMCNRQFGASASTEERTFETHWLGRLAQYEARIDDVMTDVGLVVTVSGATTTSFSLRPVNAANYSRPWERIRTTSATPPATGSGPYTILVEATWGWTAVPDAIQKATLLQAARLYRRKSAVFGVAGSPEFGSELRLLDKIDPDAAMICREYRRDWPLI